MKLQRLFCKNERFKIWIETDEFTLTGSGQTEERMKKNEMR
jgi:hypothetical protein